MSHVLPDTPAGPAASSPNHGVTARRPNSHLSALTFKTRDGASRQLVHRRPGTASPSHSLLSLSPGCLHPRVSGDPWAVFGVQMKGTSQPWPALVGGRSSLVVRGGCCPPSVEARPHLRGGGRRLGTRGLHQPSGCLEVQGPRADTRSLPPIPGTLQREGPLEAACFGDVLSGTFLWLLRIWWKEMPVVTCPT